MEIRTMLDMREAHSLAHAILDDEDCLTIRDSYRYVPIGWVWSLGWGIDSPDQLLPSTTSALVDAIRLRLDYVGDDGYAEAMAILDRRPVKVGGDQ